MRRLLALMALGALLAGCDSGPDGPGDLTGTVRSRNSSLGGAVFEVVGKGIEGFAGAGGTKVFWARQENPTTYRVIVVGEGSGELTFTVSVQDRGDRKPRATLISVVDQGNNPLPATKDIEVKFAY
jgi:hypothetical protein